MKNTMNRRRMLVALGGLSASLLAGVMPARADDDEEEHGSETTPTGPVTLPVTGIKGKVASLRRFKDDVNEVKSGLECGIGIANYNDVKPGDVIEFFTTEKVKEKLE